jgi:hypothetical protein
VSTIQKLLIGGVVVAVLSGGVAWSAIEASNSQGPTLSDVTKGGRRLPGRIGPGVRPGPGGRFGPGPGSFFGRTGGPEGLDRPPSGRGFLRNVASAELVVVDGGITRHLRLDRGTITTLASGSVTIAEADGTHVTIPVDDDTRILRSGQEGSQSDLHEGDTAFVVREGTGPARSLRAFGEGFDFCPHFPGPRRTVPFPSPSA